MIDSHFVILGAAIKVTGVIGYVIDTLKGETQPNRTMWFIWALAPGIAFVAELNQHAGLQSLLTFAAGSCALLVFVSSFLNKKAYWRSTKIDWLCGSLSVIALILWQATNDSNLALAFGIIADGVAAIPTAIKAFKIPESETSSAFLSASFAALITILTIQDWRFANYAFPVYSLCTCLLLYLLTKTNKLRTIALYLSR